MTPRSVSLDVPFRIAVGDPDRCYEAAMQSVITFYYPESSVTLEELDELVGRKPGYWTWTCQLVPVMHRLGVRVEYFTEDDLEQQGTTAGLIQLLKEVYQEPGEFERVRKKTDLEVVSARARESIDSGLYKRQRLAWPEIEARMRAGAIPMVLLDYNVLVKRDGPYQGHFVVVTGFDNDWVTYHENSEKVAEANRKVRKEDFIQAWNLDTTARDTVFATGRIKV